MKEWKRSLSGADVQAEAEDALEKDISQMSPASNSVAGQLDGGVSGGVDWASKTPKVAVSPTVEVTGSGYLLGVTPVPGGSADLWIRVDGTTLNGGGYFRLGTDTEAAGLSLNFRFENSFEVDESSDAQDLVVGYVLD